ncbi:MAG: hypothetical protein QXU11_12030 [Thermoproteota archaeon]
MKKFIESIKKPKKLSDYCKKFHEHEVGDIAYIVSRSIVSKYQNNIGLKIAGAKIIILTWNAARFQRLPQEVKNSLEKDIREAYEKTEEELRKLERKSLLNLDLADNGLKKSIESIFSEFSSKNSIGFTGASKILHVLNPDVFMMWDTSIRDAYHELHNKGHKKADPECYLEFLKQSQDIIAVLNKSTEDLWKEHLEFLDKNLVKEFSYTESILKMLDEANYLRFKRNIKL